MTSLLEQRLRNCLDARLNLSPASCLLPPVFFLSSVFCLLSPVFYLLYSVSCLLSPIFYLLPPENMPRLIMPIATGLYTGYLPKAPGTWGTLLALPVHFLISSLPPVLYGISLVIIFCLAVGTSGAAEKILDRKDPGVIVIDEIIGMLIALIGAPSDPAVWLAAFILFRFFDIVKPFPVNWFDQCLNGGLAIVIDDVAAGGYALLCLQLYYFLRTLL